MRGIESTGYHEGTAIKGIGMPSPINKPAAIRELGPVDISSIKTAILQIPERLWLVEDEKKENKKFFGLEETRHIIFRFTPGNRDHRQFYSTPLWKMWSRKLLPLMAQVVRPYGYQNPVFSKVLLARLPAGKIIPTHVDGEGSNLYTHKIHVPIQTNSQALFYIEDVPYHLQEGFSYEVNNIVKHHVENLGDTDRIHLIFECFDQER